MVYECPQCKTPLPPGVMACAKCGLQFATAIPADATVPAPGTLPLRAPGTAGVSPFAADSAPPRRVIAAVVALGVVLVLAAIYAIYTFSHTSVPNTSAPTPIASASTPPPGPARRSPTYSRPGMSDTSPAPPGNLAPVQLSGGTGSPSGTAAAGSGDAALQGRWQAKNMDFYVFNTDGTGARGSATNPAKNDTFTWVVTDNQLVLNGKKEERITFSTGPDASVLYLRMPDGRNVKFAKTGTS
jgi:hypothetical protein